MAKSPLETKIASLIYTGMKSLFLDATLTRDGANSGYSYDPDTAAAVVYACKAIPVEEGRGTQGADMAGSTEVAVLILANSLAVQPAPLDRISVPSRGIVGVIANRKKAVTSDPARATWQCWVVT